MLFVCVCVYVCGRVYVCVCAWIHLRGMYAHIQARSFGCVPRCVSVCAVACVRVCVRACVQMHVSYFANKYVIHTDL